MSAALDFGAILEANSHELESGGAKSRDIESGGCAARGGAGGAAREAREKTRGRKQEGENKSKGENKSAVEKKAGVREQGNAARSSFLFTRDMCADCQRRKEEAEAEARQAEARLAAFRCASDVLKSQIFIGAGVGNSGTSCRTAPAPPQPQPQEAAAAAAAAAAASPEVLPQVRSEVCKTLGQCALRWPDYYLAAEWLALISLNLEDTTPDTCHKVLGLRALLVQKYKY